MAKEISDELREKRRQAAYKRAEKVRSEKERIARMTVKEVMEELLTDTENKKKLCQGLIDSASKGNAKGAELILKIIGQDPNKQEQKMEQNPFE